MVFLGFGQQIERQAFALTIFATLAVIAFHLPLKLARLPFFGVVPLRSAFFFSTSDVEVPPFPQSIALILYHFVVPWTLARMKFRYLSRALLAMLAFPQCSVHPFPLRR